MTFASKTRQNREALDETKHTRTKIKAKAMRRVNLVAGPVGFRCIKFACFWATVNGNNVANTRFCLVGKFGCQRGHRIDQLPSPGTIIVHGTSRLRIDRGQPHLCQDLTALQASDSRVAHSCRLDRSGSCNKVDKKGLFKVETRRCPTYLGTRPSNDLVSTTRT